MGTTSVVKTGGENVIGVNPQACIELEVDIAVRTLLT